MKRELAMGINAVQALLDQAPERIIRAWIRPGGHRLRELEEQLKNTDISVERSDEASLDKLAGKVRHQGVIAEFHPRMPIDDKGLETLIEQTPDDVLLLVLDGVQDPNNLGACLRSAAAANATAVVVPKDRAAGLTPAARRAASGAAEIVPLAVVTNLARCLRMLAARDVWRIGLEAEAQASLFDTRLTKRLAIVLGSEDRGLRRLTRENCDEVVNIPMPGLMESLNVSVSAGIALFTAVRDRV